MRGPQLSSGLSPAVEQIGGVLDLHVRGQNDDPDLGKLSRIAPASRVTLTHRR